jgi:short-subunit dehydrogenase
MELRGFGVEVSLIEPGVIATGFADRSMSEVSRYQDASSPYAGIMSRAQELKKLTDRIAASPDVIARAIEHAAVSRFPRPRYVAPFSSAILIAFLRAIPTRWADALLKLGVGLTRRRLLASAPAQRLAA